ncbi:MAG: trehalose-phosphatase [Acidimicrobiales bacterium]
MVVSRASVEDLLEPLRSQPKKAGVLLDFDGTLARIVDDPANARPIDDMAGVLSKLARRYKRVAVLSGRAVSFLEGMLPPTVLLSGLYGLEVSHKGRRLDHPLSGAWREAIADVAAITRANGPAGMRVEDKGLSLTLHYREHPELADAVMAWAQRQATRSGLVCRPARMSCELHPPIRADKGTAVTELAEGLSSVLYAGDDLGDLPAFDALDQLAAAGCAVVRVAVASPEAPTDLVHRADIVVDDPDDALDLLRRL